MDSVERQDDHDDEVRDQERDVEGVPAVGVAEGVVAEVGVDVMADGVLVGEEERERMELADQTRRRVQGERLQG